MPTVTFQEGAAAYQGTLDTRLIQASPTLDAGAINSLGTDKSSGANVQSLLAFTGLFGDGPGQIPFGATITSASLTLVTTNASARAGSLYRMSTGWAEASTWNSMIGGVQIGTETVAGADVTFGKVGLGPANFNVTASLSAWLSGASSAAGANQANLGWLFTASDTDGWAFSSSEGSTAPKLTVTYTLPAPPPSDLSLAGSVSANEGSGGSLTSFTFTVNRGGDLSTAVTANYAVTGSDTNPATGDDFASGTLPSGTVSFAAGEASQTITINIAADQTVEANETFQVILSNATNGATISGSPATGTIVNDDVPPATLALGGGVTASEGSGASPTAFTFTVSRGGDSSTAVSANYAITGSGTSPAGADDFASGILPTGTVSFATGEISKTITVNVAADQKFEANETFDVTLSAATNGALISGATATGTIVNDDAPPASLSLAGNVTADEGSASAPTAFTFTVNRGGDTSTAVSVTYAVSGTGTSAATFGDFTFGVLPAGIVSFAAGETSKTITVNVVGDHSVESNDTFLVTLSGATNGAMIDGVTATGTIVNDDASSAVLGVKIIQGSSFGTGTSSDPNHFGSTDPTDIAYNPATGHYFVVDSEVEEKPFFSSTNMFELDGQGNRLAGFSLTSFTSEPTGVAVWVTPTGEQHLFITDDDKQRVFEVDAANPTILLRSFSTVSFGAIDPEDISINPNNGNLFISSENDHRIYEITQAGALVSTTWLPDSFVPIPDPNALDSGAEGLVYDASRDVFYVGGGFSTEIFVVSRAGTIVDTINILDQYPNANDLRVYTKGLALGPSSDGSGHMSLWVTDYGLDQVPDGRLIEVMLSQSSSQTPPPVHPLTGTTADDLLQAIDDGNWTIDGLAGNDTINGLGGNDVLTGAAGNDTIFGGAGDDAIHFGGAAAGFDTIDGGAGIDRIEATANGTAIGLMSVTGVEVISSNGFSSVTIAGTSAADFFDFTNVTLKGISSINGGGGNDNIIGSMGRDVFAGRAGADILTGNGGADSFDYNAISESTVAAPDRILDFQAGTDKLDVSGIDAVSSTAGNQAFTLIGEALFGNVAGQLRFDHSDVNLTVVSGDTTGDGVADFAIQLAGNVPLHPTDFVL